MIRAAKGLRLLFQTLFALPYGTHRRTESADARAESVYRKAVAHEMLQARESVRGRALDPFLEFMQAQLDANERVLDVLMKLSRPGVDEITARVAALMEMDQASHDVIQCREIFVTTRSSALVKLTSSVSPSR